MSKKLGLEGKYKQFINPTQLGKYKAVMGKIKTESGKLKDLKSSTFASGFSKAYKQANMRQAASSVLKKSPIGKIVTGISKAFMSKPGFFGAGVGIGANVKKDNKKMGGGMMRYSNGSKDTVKLSARQKVIAAKAPPPNKIDGKDFAVLKAEKAKGRGQGLQDENMKPGKIIKAGLGAMILGNKKSAVKAPMGMGAQAAGSMNSMKMDLMKKLLGKKTGGVMKANKGVAVDFDETTYNIKDVYKLANKNKTEARPTSKDVKEAARILNVKLPPKAR